MRIVPGTVVTRRDALVAAFACGSIHDRRLGAGGVSFVHRKARLRNAGPAVAMTRVAGLGVRPLVEVARALVTTSDSSRPNPVTACAQLCARKLTHILPRNGRQLRQVESTPRSGHPFQGTNRL